MKLDAYLDREKITDAEFAVSVGLSRSMVTRLRGEKARPSAAAALRIEVATKQAVTLADLMPVSAGAADPDSRDETRSAQPEPLAPEEAA